MSLFSEQLSIALKTHGLTQVEFAKMTGLAAPQINRYIKGRHTKISQKILTTLLDALPDALTRVNVLHAYLLDNIPKKYRDALPLSPDAKPHAIQDPTEKYQQYLDQPDIPLNRTIAIIRKEAITNPPLRDLLECITELF